MLWPLIDIQCQGVGPGGTAAALTPTDTSSSATAYLSAAMYFSDAVCFSAALDCMASLRHRRENLIGELVVVVIEVMPAALGQHRGAGSGAGGAQAVRTLLRAVDALQVDGRELFQFRCNRHAGAVVHAKPPGRFDFEGSRALGR